MNTSLKLWVIMILALLMSSQTMTAQIHSAKITYERKTNLYKRFKNWDVKEWLDESDKIKIDNFILQFNDSLSSFVPVESEIRERMSWATQSNKTYQNFKTEQSFKIKNVWGEEFCLNDSLKPITWKITDSKRKIAGFECTKAIYQVDDSTKIYAWYCLEIEPSVGPENFYGLPGAILGLASEDGGIVYFAKKIEIIPVNNTDLVLGKYKKKMFKRPELKKTLQDQFGNNKWAKPMIANILGVW